jgi:hypothetical protein
VCFVKLILISLAFHSHYSGKGKERLLAQFLVEENNFEKWAIYKVKDKVSVTRVP